MKSNNLFRTEDLTIHIKMRREVHTACNLISTEKKNQSVDI